MKLSLTLFVAQELSVISIPHGGDVEETASTAIDDGVPIENVFARYNPTPYGLVTRMQLAPSIHILMA